MKIRGFLPVSLGARPRLFILGMAVLIFTRPVLCQRLTDPYTNLDFGLGYGARALSLGGAFIAVGDGLAAVGSNPAGLARLTRVEFGLGAGYGGQAASVPPGYGDYSEWGPFLPPASAYQWSESHASLRHAGLASSIRAGRQVFVLALSYHRELDFGASYEYSVLRNGPYVYSPDPATNIEGTLEYAENYRVANTGSLDVITGSLAFRIAKNVYFGVNLNFWKGEARLEEAEDYAFVFSGPDAFAWSGQGSAISTGSIRYSTAMNLDFGLQWVTRLFSAGLVFKTGSGLDSERESTSDESATYSDGTVYEYHNEHLYGWVDHWPAQFGFGFSLHPGERWMWSIEVRTASQFPDSGFPGVKNQIRTGAEYLLPVRAVVIPLRAGWFMSETDILLPGGWAWLQGFTFGTGLLWKSFAWDIGAVLHSRAFDVTYWKNPVSDPLKRSCWDVVTSLTYRLGKQS